MPRGGCVCREPACPLDLKLSFLDSTPLTEGDALKSSGRLLEEGVRDREPPLEVGSVVLQEREAAMSESRWALVISLLFYAVALFGVFHHEMWRDEYQAWMIARSSSSFADLLWNLRYEGTGCLWHLCLFLIVQFTEKPLSMQIFNVSVASCGAYIVARYSPFPRWQKALIVFSYFSLFEYGIISRCYALGNTLVLGAAAILTQKRKWSWVLAVLLLGLAANTSLFAALIAFSLTGGMALGLRWARRAHRRNLLAAKNDEVLPRKRREVAFTVIAFLIFIVLSSFSLAQICPPADGYRGDGQLWQTFFGDNAALKRLQLSVASPLIGYFPLPDPRYGYMFRDSTIFGGADLVLRSIWAVLSAAVVAIFAASLWRSKPAFLAYVVGTVAIIGFFDLVLLGSVRHDGQLFILLVCCLWLARLYPDAGTGDNLRREPRILAACRKAANLLFSLILTCQVGMSAFAVFADYKYVFSPIVDVARYLKRTQREREFIAVIPDWLGVGLSGTLNRSVYELGAGRLSTFTTGGAKKDLSNHEQVLMECNRLLARERLRELLLVIDTQIHASNENLVVTKLKSFRNGIVLYENMYLYSIKPRNPSLDSEQN